MKIKFNHVVLAGLSMLSMAGCLADEPATDPDQAVTSTAAETTYRINPALTGNHQIVNLQYNQCIDAPGGALNVVLRLATCSSSTTQKWAFVAASAPNTFFLVNQNSGFCAEVNNGTSTPGELVDEWHCDGSTAEQWVQSIRVIDGVSYQQYTHAGTSLCLDTVGSAGSQLMQWNCSGSNNTQTWLVR